MGIKMPFVSEIAPDTFVINEFGLAAMYLVVGEKRALLVDTGCGVSDVKGLVERLTDKPYDVFLTHGHLDHAGGVGAFDKIYASERDFEMIRNVSAEELRNYCDNLGKQGGYDVFDYGPDMVKEITKFPEMINVDDGYVFDLGGRTLSVIAVSGHTPGGLALLDEKNRILISGDCANVNTLALWGTVEEMKIGFEKLKKLSDKFDQNWNGHVGYAGMPFICSQPKTVIDDLIHICDLILEGKAEPTESNFLGRTVTGVNYGAARLVYDPNHIRK